MDMNYFVSLLQSYWGIIASGLGFGVYGVFQFQNAKKIILSIMIQLEKEAENLALSTGDAKFTFLVDKGYQILPQGARIFITPAMFESLAQTLYNEAKDYLVNYIPVAPVVPVPDIAVPTAVNNSDQQTA